MRKSTDSQTKSLLVCLHRFTWVRQIIIQKNGFLSCNCLEGNAFWISMYWNQLFRPPPRNFCQFSRGGPKPPFCGAGRASLIQYMGGWQGLRQDCQEGQRRGGGKELDEFLRCLSCLDIPLPEKFSSTRDLLVLSLYTIACKNRYELVIFPKPYFKSGILGFYLSAATLSIVLLIKG